ncbi:SHOCT domain-containing protein [Microbacterium esteraromaticum]|uniref:SHOCT domain-containing protein n=1 Tax=Microbacterium esteraromaticum TaxID=57043 RepID=UPI00309CA536
MDDLIIDDTPLQQMSGFMTLFGVLFVGVLIFIVVSVVRRWKVARDAGYDPLAMDTQIAAQLGRSELLRAAEPTAPGAPAQQRSIEDRLSELDDLHARGVISDAEHAAARTKALEG